jgi:RIO-like serine/threonine protein kinase
MSGPRAKGKPERSVCITPVEEVALVAKLVSDQVFADALDRLCTLGLIERRDDEGGPYLTERGRAAALVIAKRRGYKLKATDPN